MPVTLHVEEHGPRGASVAVLVHGSMDRTESFRRVVRRLPDVRVIAYDRRGYAGSVNAGAVRSLAAHVEDLLAVVDGQTVVVVGHSYGGLAALAAAIAAPSRVTAVGAFEAPMPWAPWWPPRTAGAAAIGAGTPPEAAEAFFRRVVGDTAWERQPEPVKAARRAEGEALLGDMVSIEGAQPPIEFGRVAVPVVAAYGTASLPYHQAAARELAGAVAGADLVSIEGAGHGAHLSHPDAFARFVRRVVERGQARPAEV